MNRIHRLIVITLFVSSIAVVASAKTSTSNKQEALIALREQFARTPYRSFKRLASVSATATSHLSDAGLFSDMTDVEQKAFQRDLIDPSSQSQHLVADRLKLAMDRIWAIAETLRKVPRPLSQEQTLLQKRLFRAIIHYGQLEHKRPNVSARFHISCFAIPLAAANIYFCFYPEMNALEQGEDHDPTTIQAHDTLQALGYQAWTVPARNDATDKNPVSIDRFRHHVWWVGGNGFTYRPVLAVALMRNSQKMLDVLSDAASDSLSVTSYSTNQISFWTEGMTTDGAGWGHGKQNQVFAYPLDGLFGTLNILTELKGTPWQKTLTQTKLDCLMNYIRGSSWFYYRGYVPPVIERFNMAFGNLGPNGFRPQSLVVTLLNQYADQLSAAQTVELKANASLVGERNAPTLSGEHPNYRGVRYFWNQDALAIKSNDYYMLISMASCRKDGLESTVSPATAWNFFTDDGQTLVYRDGNEYTDAIGAWDLTAIPGVTARQGEDQLKPITNWRGYNSSSNFAGGLAHADNGCAGFIFEKQNASLARDVNDKIGADDPNTLIYGIRAHKAWFVIHDAMLALGAGITDLKPDLSGDVWTTINQTAWQSPITARDTLGDHFQSPPPGNQAIAWILTSSDNQQMPVMVAQGGFVYVIFPQYTTGDVKVSGQRRATKWNKLAKDNEKRKTPTTADVFQLWIDHGAHPKNASYAYLISPNLKIDPAHPPIQVLFNSESLQAVRSANGSILQAIFYKPGTLIDQTDGLRISVDVSCTLMIEKMADGWDVTVDDPEQLVSKRAVRVTVSLPWKGENISTQANGTSTLTMDLPREPLLGKPVTIHVPVEK